MNADVPLHSKDDLLSFLTRLGIGIEVEAHALVLTMDESATLRLRVRGLRCKNLLVQAKKSPQLFLVVTTPGKPVDLTALGQMLVGARFSLCPENVMREMLGVTLGGMSPFALVNDMGREPRAVRLIVDREVQGADRLLLHPLVNASSVSIRFDDLQRFVEATGHILELVDIPVRQRPESAERPTL